jgi:hypothetical protein
MGESVKGMFPCLATEQSTQLMTFLFLVSITAGVNFIPAKMQAVLKTK